MHINFEICKRLHLPVLLKKKNPNPKGFRKVLDYGKGNLNVKVDEMSMHN